MHHVEVIADDDGRLAELEVRVAALEAALPSPARTAPVAAAPARTDSADAGGEVRYGGTVRLHGEIEWNVHYAAAGVLHLAAAPAAGALAALGHPGRIAIVRRLLSGPATARELVQAADLSSTGQLYHHLQSLTSARFVEQDSRGSYRMPPTAVVPTLVLLLAAADITGQLR